jgi:succinyl-CoA synthetase alpha subunit
MTISHRSYPNLYKDSVSLMKVTAEVMAVPGIETASVVMTSATNVENLATAGLGTFEVRPNDLVVVVKGSDDACAAALDSADALIRESAASAASDGQTVAQPVTSIEMAVGRDPAINFALVSVPGDYAAAEALKALRLGLDVMVFSDNVSVEAERTLKDYADAHGLMVMGPDCGTAIVNGIPLGFANVVRRGAIGVVGASGTGTQEVTVRVDRLGEGVSQALGTGGHDLSDAIGGISMLHGLRALIDDPATKVIVLVSKPPSEPVAAKVLEVAEATDKPVVVIFLGADPAGITRNGVYGAAYLAQAADMAVALLKGKPAAAAEVDIAPNQRRKLDDVARAMAPSQRFARGIFCGGTFCFETQLILAAAGHTAESNAPVKGNDTPQDIARSRGNTVLDMGDDAFTQGRPHPMIDPSLRDARVRAEADDPTTAVIVFDVVLGYGASADPAKGLVGAIGASAAKARAAGRRIAFIGHVCGTDADPQNRVAIVRDLEAAGVMIAGSNAEAATWAAAILNARKGA